MGKRSYPSRPWRESKAIVGMDHGLFEDTGMISDSLRFEDFVEAVKGKDQMEMIAAANEEATEAERRYYRMRARGKRSAQVCLEYSTILKNLIAFLRYGLRYRGFDEEQVELLNSLCADLKEKYGRTLRCHGTA